MMASKKILFFGIHRPNRSPSQRYRIEQFLPYLELSNMTYDYDFLLNSLRDKAFYTPGNYLQKLGIVVFSMIKLIYLTLFKIKYYDYVFVQREAFMLGSSFFEKQWAKKSKLIFDFDDAIWQLDVSEANRKLAFLKNPSKTKEIITVSHKVVVGNQYLYNYAAQFNKNVVLIPTCVDTHEYTSKFKSNNHPICIGWSGSQTTVKHFELAIPILEKLKKHYGNMISFKLIGDGTYKNERLGIVGVAWNRDTEIDELAGIDIGIMPLPNEEWAKGKCALKGLVYMAMGLPSVIADVGVNSTIVKNGENAFLASTDDEWFDKLEQLINSHSLRETMGNNAREYVEQHFSINQYKDDFLDLFS